MKLWCHKCSAYVLAVRDLLNYYCPVCGDAIEPEQPDSDEDDYDEAEED